MSASVLLIGSGGREHAISWKISQSPAIKRIFVAPGNGGTVSEKIVNVSIDSSKIEDLVSFAVDNKIDLVIAGPEQPLVDGITDALKKVGIPCFGPSKLAARIEGSKAFSKDFMKKYNIPTAEYKTFTDYEEAKKYVMSLKHKHVIKASGLAAGKGVILPETKEESIEALDSIMKNKIFGDAGNEVVIEEFLEGEEVSVLCFSDGYTVIPLPPAQDHKRAYDNDTGPNTGGMGAYAPAPIATKKLIETIHKTVLLPTLKGMRKEGHPYVGILYAGIMVTKQGPKVLEYNCRFGDPETQVVLPLLKSDLYEIMNACVEGRLDSTEVIFHEGSAATVVLASQGYPGNYPKGKEIKIEKIDESLNVTVFHAGTILKEKQLLTSGGRVISVTSVALNLSDAVNNAYSAIKNIHFDGMHYRKDIAHRALKRKGESVTYADAGVDIDMGDKFVDFIKPLAKKTMRPGSMENIGGFGGLFDIKATGYKDPILVAGTDGVGTKLRVAQIANIHNTIGIDLVAMSINDLVVQGAEPLFFLDYYASSHLKLEISNKVMEGIIKGCIESNCCLLGGETAEMPGMYMDEDYDVAGFGVGVVERDQLLPKKVSDGDIILGLPSSGIHSNGYSLVRYLVEKNNLDYNSPSPFVSSNPDAKTLAEALLVPTRLYVKSCVPLAKHNLIQALAHITGGGLLDNIPRVLPENLSAVLDANCWDLPPVFKWLAKLGNMQRDEVARTFNCGIGMIVVVTKENVEKVISHLKSIDEPVIKIGKIAPIVNGKQVCIENIDKWF